MSTIEKLKKKFYSSPTPKDITIDEVIRLANHYECIIRTGGNHQITVVNKEKTMNVPLPQHDKEVKQAYIRQLRELFNDEEMKGK